MTNILSNPNPFQKYTSQLRLNPNVVALFRRLINPHQKGFQLYSNHVDFWKDGVPEICGHGIKLTGITTKPSVGVELQTRYNDYQCDILESPNFEFYQTRDQFHLAFGMFPFQINQQAANEEDEKNIISPVYRQDKLLLWKCSEGKANRSAPEHLIGLEGLLHSVICSGYFASVVPKRWIGREMRYMRWWDNHAALVARIKLPTGSVQEEGRIGLQHGPPSPLSTRKYYDVPGQWELCIWQRPGMPDETTPNSQANLNKMTHAEFRFSPFLFPLASFEEESLKLCEKNFRQHDWWLASLKHWHEMIDDHDSNQWCGTHRMSPHGLKQQKEVWFFNPDPKFQYQIQVVPSTKEIAADPLGVQIQVGSNVSLKCRTIQAMGAMLDLKAARGIIPAEDRKKHKFDTEATMEFNFTEEIRRKSFIDIRERLIADLSNHGLTPYMTVNDHQKMKRRERWLALQLTPIPRLIQSGASTEEEQSDDKRNWELLYEDMSMQALFPEVYNLWKKRALDMGMDRHLCSFQLEDVVTAACKQSMLLGNVMGIGKASRSNSRLLTPSGWITFADVKVGQQVIDPIGGKTTVTGVYPQGKIQVYRVKFNDGSWTECSGEHLWNVNTPMRRYRGNPAKVMTLNEIIKKGLKDRSGNLQHFIPMCVSPSFDEQHLLADPYLMGYLIGNGYLARGVSVTIPDRESVARIDQIINEDSRCSNLHLVQMKDDREIHFNISCKEEGEKNFLLETLRLYKLIGCHAETKFIPKTYLLGSHQQRIALLQGLCDSDGSPCGANVEYSTSSKQLHLDFIELVQSLGGIATVSTKIPTYTHNNQHLEGQLSYRIIVSLPPNIKPFRLPRKAELFKVREKYFPARAIKSIEPIGEHECICISVASESKLYVTDNYIVTHNTRETLFHMLLRGTKHNLIVCPKRLIGIWQDEIQDTIIPYIRRQRRNWMGEVIDGTTKVLKTAADCIPSTLATFNIISYEKLKSIPKDGKFYKCPECGVITYSAYPDQAKAVLCPGDPNKEPEQRCSHRIKRWKEGNKKIDGERSGRRKYKVLLDANGNIVKRFGHWLTTKEIQERMTARDREIDPNAPDFLLESGDGKILYKIDLYDERPPRPEIPIMEPMEHIYKKMERYQAGTEVNKHTGEEKPLYKYRERDFHVKWTFAEILRWSFNFITCDEAIKIMNEDSKTTQAFVHLCAQTREPLSGTPIKGFPERILSILNWALKREVFPDYRNAYIDPQGEKRFLQKYRTEVLVGGVLLEDGTMAGGKKKTIPKVNNPELFQAELAPYMLRHTRNEPPVTKDFPRKKIIRKEIMVDMDEEHKAYYRKWQQEFAEWWGEMKSEEEGASGKQGEIMTKLTYLMNASTIPHYMLENILKGEDEVGKGWARRIGRYKGPPVAKMKKCWELVGDAVKAFDKTIVGSARQKNSDLGKYWADKVGLNSMIVDGRVPLDPKKGETRGQRHNVIEDFKNQNYHVMWAGLNALSEGFNIPEANRGIALDTDWDPSMVRQFFGRMIRPSQMKPVYCMSLIHNGAVDGFMFAWCELKARSIDEALDYMEFNDFSVEMIPDVQQYADAIVDGTQEKLKQKMWSAIEHIRKQNKEEAGEE